MSVADLAFYAFSTVTVAAGYEAGAFRGELEAQHVGVARVDVEVHREQVHHGPGKLGFFFGDEHDWCKGRTFFRQHFQTTDAVDDCQILTADNRHEDVVAMQCAGEVARILDPATCIRFA